MTIESLKDNIRDLADEIYPIYNSMEVEGLVTREDIINQVLFESIKVAFDRKQAEEKQSIRQHLINNDMDTESNRRTFSRRIQYVQYYRDTEAETRKKEENIIITELYGKDMTDIDNRMAGHEISNMNFLELCNMNEIQIFQKVVGRQIQDSKKVSNKQFVELYDAYDSLLNDYMSKMLNEETLVFYTVAFFTLEWKYALEWFYKISSIAAKDNLYEERINRAKMGCVELRVQAMSEYYLPQASGVNRNYMLRDRFIPYIFESTEDEWEHIQVIYAEAFRLKTMLKTYDNNFLDQLVYKLPVEEWAKFIKQDYWIWDKISKKEWTAKKIKIARKLFQMCFRDTETPTIK